MQGLFGHRRQLRAGPERLFVGAFDQEGELDARTNYGACVNIFAPGVAIKSAGTIWSRMRVVLYKIMFVYFAH